MFDKKRKTAIDFNGIKKNTTFGNDSDEESSVDTEILDVEDFMKSMDGEIKNAKQREANASIAQVYSSSGQKQAKVKQSINACGCFGG